MARIPSILFVVLCALGLAFSAGVSAANPASWSSGDWPNTDFEKHSVPYSEIMSGGPPKDGIPPIDDPVFESLEAAAASHAPNAPVIAVVVNGKAKAYPLSVLIWHEIVNDVIGGVPVTVTYCPLCNAAIVFDRRVFDSRVGERVLDFGTTGKLRKSDLVMWDRQTESWWQQFLGEAIVGEMTGQTLKIIPSRMESFVRFQRRRPDGVVLKPNQPQLRAYGRNPYVSYDSAPWPFLYRGDSPDGIAPLARVIAIGKQAFSLDLLQKRGAIKAGRLMLSWAPGQASALDAALIGEGRDVGNVIVQTTGSHGPIDVAHDIIFAFVFHGFRPEGLIYVDCPAGKAPAKPLVCHE